MSAPTNFQPTLTPSGNGGRDTFYTVIYYLTLVLFGISVVSSCIFLLTFMLFKRIRYFLSIPLHHFFFVTLRTYPIKLIMYLCVTVIVAHTCFILSFLVRDIDWLCTIVGAFLHTSLLANFLWCLCIAFNFYQMVGLFF